MEISLRNGKRETLTAKLDKRPEGGATAGGASTGTQEQLGLSVQALTEELAQRLGYEGASGVVVTDVQPGSAAAEAGIRPGTLIMEVDQEPIKTVRAFNEALRKAQKKGKVLLRVRTEDWMRFIVVPLSKE